MYTINHMWVANIDGEFPEARSNVYGIYNTIEEAKIELSEWFMKMPNNGCEIIKYTDEQYSFISPDKKTRGFIEIQKIEQVEDIHE